MSAYYHVLGQMLIDHVKHCRRAFEEGFKPLTLEQFVLIIDKLKS